jgi:hypothetical protein
VPRCDDSGQLRSVRAANPLHRSAKPVYTRVNPLHTLRLLPQTVVIPSHTLRIRYTEDSDGHKPLCLWPRHRFFAWSIAFASGRPALRSGEPACAVGGVRRSFHAPRRGGRVVECSGLENRRTGNRSVSSNLTHAAVTQNKDVPGGPHPGGPRLFRLPSRLPATVEAHLGLFQRCQPIMNNRIDFGEEGLQLFAGIHDLNYYRQVE